MELREKIAEIVAPYVPSPGWGDAVADALPIADAILALPELDPTPTKQRILAMLGGLRDGMTPQQVRTVQWFADQFPSPL